MRLKSAFAARGRWPTGDGGGSGAIVSPDGRPADSRKTEDTADVRDVELEVDDRVAGERVTV